MPYSTEWVPPQQVLWRNGVYVYCTYGEHDDIDDVSDYIFETDEESANPHPDSYFDVRPLAEQLGFTLVELTVEQIRDDYQLQEKETVWPWEKLLRAAIDAGLVKAYRRGE